MPYNKDNDLIQAKENTTLILMKQNSKEEYWCKDAEFYLSVLVTQKKVDTTVYTSEVLG